MAIHAITDGRDTPTQSAPRFVHTIEEAIRSSGVGEIASLCGRYWAMDRDQRWERTSRAHALLLTYYGYPAIFDLLTSNGTFVNDEAQSFRQLEPEDILKIGDSEFRIRFAGTLVNKKTSTNGSARRSTSVICTNAKNSPASLMKITRRVYGDCRPSCPGPRALRRRTVWP